MQLRSARTRVSSQEVLRRGSGFLSCDETAALGFHRSKALLLRLCDNRQNHPNGRSTSDFAIRFDPAPVELGDVFHYRQPKSSASEFAAACFVRAIKSFENPRQIF